MNPATPAAYPEELRYAMLRAASQLFEKPPKALGPDELNKAAQQARREYEIEAKILTSQEAGRVIVPAESVERAYAEVRERYEDEDAFAIDLADNGLDDPRLRAALERQCKVESVLELVGSRSPTVNEIDIALFYHNHLERFQQPERREAYHILISLNPDYPENTREAAEQRLLKIAERLKQKPHEFERLAGRHSECPTAMQGGRLGPVPRGELYPELDAALFALKEGKLSGVVESPMGFHLVWCKSIIPGQTLSLQKASGQIRQVLQARYQRTCQRAWVASLTGKLKSGE